jgi:hypothetical protein
MASKFTVHAFGVKHHDDSQPLVDILKQIEKDGIAIRNRTIKGAPVRVEHIEFDTRNNIWYLDFIKIRDTHGPAKGSKTKAVQGFNFVGDETFCEETALIYIPKTNHMLIQYNHYGVKYSVIEDYLSQYIEAVNNIYELTPKYDADVERQFEDRKFIKKLDMAIDPRHLSKEDRAKGTALVDAIDIGDKSEAAHISIAVKASRTKKGHLNPFIDKTVETLRRIQLLKPKAVSKIKASVVGIDEKVAVLDLIAHRLTMSLGDIKPGKDKRWPRADRYRGLFRVMTGWKKVLK